MAGAAAVVFAVFAVGAGAGAAATPVVVGPSICHGVENWTVSFEDEFQGASLNLSRWTVRDNMTHGSTEKQLYVAHGVSVSGTGELLLTTRRERAKSAAGKLYNFTSGWVESRGKAFQAGGRFEVRAKLPPAAAGRAGKWPTAWPAHWLMPEPSTSRPPNVCWPVGGEIDIMEAYRPANANAGDGDGKNEEEDVVMTYHWADACGHDLWTGQQGRFARPGADWSDAFHTYAVEWLPGEKITWFVDALPRYEVRKGTPEGLTVPEDPFYMILNTALQSWADAGLDTGFPMTHAIDRVTWCVPEEGVGVEGAGREAD